MVKTALIKLMSVLLTVWYVMSIIGFDVHTCSGSGRSFVTSFVEGMTCADIHPEHVCSPESCCAEAQESLGCCGHSHHDEECVTDHSDCQYCDGTVIKTESCCSNDYQVLHLTGTVPSDDHRHYDECSCGRCPCLEFPLSLMPQPSVSSSLFSHVHKSDSGISAAGDRQAALSIWRI